MTQCSNAAVYLCQCGPNREGDNCETVIDDCASNPCGDGTCSNVDRDFFGVAKYTCDCDDGFRAAGSEFQGYCERK